MELAPLGRYFLARSWCGWLARSGIGDPVDICVAFQIFGHSLCIGHVAIHAQAQCLDAHQRVPTVLGRLAGADVTQCLDTRLDAEGRQAHAGQIGVDQAVVAGIGRGEVVEAPAGPVEVAAVDDDAADGGAVAAQELGGAVGDDVGAPFERAAEIGRGKGVVDHQRDVVGLCDGRNLFEGEDKDVGIAQGLTVDDLGVGLDCGLKGGRIAGVDKGDVDAQARERVVELVEGAAIEPCAADDVIACAAEGEDGHGLRAVAAAGRDRGHTALKISHTLLKHIGGRIHDAGVDVAELLQRKQIGSMFRIAELVAGRLIDRHGTAAGCWVRGLAGMQLSC